MTSSPEPTPSQVIATIADLQAQSGHQLATLAQVHLNWAQDAKDVGKKIDASMTAAGDILKQLATLQSRILPNVVTPTLAVSKPVAALEAHAKPTVIYKSSVKAILITVILSVVVALCAAYGFYRFSSVYKAEMLGTTLSERWNEFDKETD